MKIPIKNLFFVPMLVASLGLMLGGRVAAQTYTFGPQVQSTNTASITYNSGTGMFEYIDATNSSKDNAYLPLTGPAASFITTSNGWTASLAANLPATSMTATGTESPRDGLGLGVISMSLNDFSAIFGLVQVNNTGSTAEHFPNNFYGTVASFSAQTNATDDVTTPLGASVSVQGHSVLVLSGGTNTSAATESIGIASGILTLTFDASTDTLTGYYDGTPVASYSIASWGSNPPLTFVVGGWSGGGVGVPAGANTGSNFYAGLLPELAIIRSGADTVITWPTNGAGFTLQSATNLLTPNWSAVSAAPVVLATNNVVTNVTSGRQMFFRLIYP
jgi:hypothetical protein